MYDALSIVIIDDSRNTQITDILKREFKVSKVMKTSNTIDALNVIGDGDGVAIVFIDYETTLDRTFSFIQNAIATENCKKTKFCLMAKDVDRDFLLEASKSGVSAFIQKPFKDKKLVRKLGKLLPLVQKREANRLNLLESIEATLRYKGKEIVGGIEDISSGGCLIRTKRFGRMNLEIYDVVTIKVNFENEKLGINAQAIRMEKDETKDYKAITTAFKFTKPDAENALQFAKFWAYILKERKVA